MRKTPKAKSVSGRDDVRQKIHFTQIDILKGLAIISVILIHTYNSNILFAIGAPFYIWQAVPVFLLLAGFTNAYALFSANKTTLAESYDLSVIFRRLKRLIPPYLVIWIFQLVIVLGIFISGINIHVQDTNHFFYTGVDWIFNFLSGASGQGHYFVPLIIQFIFLTPFFYYLALRSPNQMLVFALILDLGLEYISAVSGLPSWLYSVLCIRFIFICGLGVWLAFQERVMTRWILLGGLLSALYIFAVCYLNFQFWFFSVDPTFFHAFAFFWTLVIVVLGFQYLPSDPSNSIVRILTELGKASWHIFLVQMTFFFVFENLLIYLGGFASSIFILTAVSLIPCLLIGYGFYRVMEYMTPRKNTNRKKISAR